MTMPPTRTILRYALVGLALELAFIACAASFAHQAIASSARDRADQAAVVDTLEAFGASRVRAECVTQFCVARFRYVSGTRRFGRQVRRCHGQYAVSRVYEPVPDQNVADVTVEWDDWTYTVTTVAEACHERQVYRDSLR